MPSSVTSRSRPSASRRGRRRTATVHGLGAASTAPVRLRSSAASVGPRNGASTRPRPSSSATMAASTPDAPSDAQVRQPGGGDRLLQPGGPLGVVEVDRRTGPEVVGQLGGARPAVAAAQWSDGRP